MGEADSAVTWSHPDLSETVMTGWNSGSTMGGHKVQNADHQS